MCRLHHFTSLTHSGIVAWGSQTFRLIASGQLYGMDHFVSSDERTAPLGTQAPKIDCDFIEFVMRSDGEVVSWSPLHHALYCDLLSAPNNNQGRIYKTSKHEAAPDSARAEETKAAPSGTGGFPSPGRRTCHGGKWRRPRGRAAGGRTWSVLRFHQRIPGRSVDKIRSPGVSCTLTGHGGVRADKSLHKWGSHAALTPKLICKKQKRCQRRRVNMYFWLLQSD